ncbi:Pre-mRNA-splicing factor [Lachnellula hyalina]|uniref:Pre-mRNA-splicing factor CWC24 n=1 Tax=Lachnellula hyalina TaxID=1316788 RepID=A0A8H8U3M7_9HELO|nr:Pre-mRNA-splicing factor [Lachnellula hyalina]TVY30174.1 Pre-mRNA-splicing factor [Lachnellula hyalina]
MAIDYPGVYAGAITEPREQTSNAATFNTIDTLRSPKTPPAAPPVAIFKKRSAKGKSNFRKRAATPPPASDSDDSAYSSSEDESGRKIKRRKKNTGVVTASSRNNTSSNTDLTASIYSADRSTTMKSSNDATKQSNWYDENATDALSTKNLLGSTRAAPAEAADGTYKGLANATTFIQKNPDAPKRVMGPVKAPTNIRTITVTDFAPDVCKDYKQTGFCGFGDNCKYLHAREDYKQGWQLDKEWENVTKGKKVGGTKVASANRDAVEEDSDDDDAMLEGIPFACILCRESYKDPILTKCGHYFCLNCALTRYKKDPSCAACGAGTGGMFNGAKGLKKLLDKKREKAAKRRQKAIEAGEEVSDEEEEE